MHGAHNCQGLLRENRIVPSAEAPQETIHLFPGPRSRRRWQFSSGRWSKVGNRSRKFLPLRGEVRAAIALDSHTAVAVELELKLPPRSVRQFWNRHAKHRFEETGVHLREGDLMNPRMWRNDATGTRAPLPIHGHRSNLTLHSHHSSTNATNRAFVLL